MARLGVVGVLGGMGPLATIDFMRKMLDATPAARDQDHVPVVVSSIPQVPDRPKAWRGEGESPLPAMVASGRRLVDAGVGLIVVPCNTAHLWFDDLERALGVPMLHLVDAAIEDAKAAALASGASGASALPGARPRIGLLATDAALASGLYTERQPSAVQWLLPTQHEMQEWVTPAIAAVKAGRLTDAAAPVGAAARALEQRGAAALVLGCTELPLVFDAADARVTVIDAAASLAHRAVQWSLQQRSDLPDAYARSR